MQRSYTYNPAKLGEKGKDRMRFELGDTMVEGEAQTCALSDEEYAAILDIYQDKWRRAKLALIESILRRFSYEVDTRVGPLSLSLSQRLEVWKAMYQELKKECAGACVPSSKLMAIDGEHYFYAGMMENKNASPKGGGRFVP